jgi:hypothetical protein
VPGRLGYRLICDSKCGLVVKESPLRDCTVERIDDRRRDMGNIEEIDINIDRNSLSAGDYLPDKYNEHTQLVTITLSYDVFLVLYVGVVHVWDQFGCSSEPSLVINIDVL